MGILLTDRISLSIDLDYAEKQFGMRFEELAQADDFNFTHNIMRIQNNIDRITGEIGNCFVPRYSK